MSLMGPFWPQQITQYSPVLFPLTKSGIGCVRWLFLWREPVSAARAEAVSQVGVSRAALPLCTGMLVSHPLLSPRSPAAARPVSRSQGTSLPISPLLSCLRPRPSAQALDNGFCCSRYHYMGAL